VSEKVVASRKVKAVDSKGKVFDLGIIVGQPYQLSDREWACPVSLKGLYKLGPIHGVESLQALMLALRLLKKLLEDFCEKGGSLFGGVEKRPVTVNELLSYVL
jgi:hypothetical protein